MENPHRVITRVGVTTVGAGSLLAAPWTTQLKRSTIHITFVAGAASTLGLSGLGTGAPALLNSGSAVPLATIWTGSMEIDQAMGPLDFLVSAAGTYTLIVSENSRW